MKKIIKSILISTLAVATIGSASAFAMSCGETPPPPSKDQQLQTLLDKAVTEIDRDDSNTGTQLVPIPSDATLTTKTDVLSKLGVAWAKDPEVTQAIADLNKLAAGTFDFNTVPAPSSDTTFTFTTKLMWIASDGSTKTTSTNPLTFYFSQPRPQDDLQDALDAFVTALNDPLNVEYVTFNSTAHIADAAGLMSQVNLVWHKTNSVMLPLIDKMKGLTHGDVYILQGPSSYNDSLTFSSKIVYKFSDSGSVLRTSAQSVQFTITNKKTDAQIIQDKLDALATIISTTDDAHGLTLKILIETTSTADDLFQAWSSLASVLTTIKPAWDDFNSATQNSGKLSFTTPPLPADMGGASISFISGLTWTPVTGTALTSTSSNIDFLLVNGDRAKFESLDDFANAINLSSAAKSFTLKVNAATFDELRTQINAIWTSSVLINLQINTLKQAFDVIHEPGDWALDDSDLNGFDYTTSTLNFTSHILFKTTAGKIYQSSQQITFALDNPAKKDAYQSAMDDFYTGLTLPANLSKTIGSATARLVLSTKATTPEELFTALKAIWADSTNPVAAAYDTLISSGSIAFKTEQTPTAGDFGFTTTLVLTTNEATPRTIESSELNFYITNHTQVLTPSQIALDAIVTALNANQAKYLGTSGTGGVPLQFTFKDITNAQAQIDHIWNPALSTQFTALQTLVPGSWSLETPFTNFTAGAQSLTTKLVWTSTDKSSVLTSSETITFNINLTDQNQVLLDKLADAISKDDTATGKTALPITLIKKVQSDSELLSELETVWLATAGAGTPKQTAVYRALLNVKALSGATLSIASGITDWSQSTLQFRVGLSLTVNGTTYNSATLSSFVLTNPAVTNQNLVTLQEIANLLIIKAAKLLGRITPNPPQPIEIKHGTIAEFITGLIALWNTDNDVAAKISSLKDGQLSVTNATPPTWNAEKFSKPSIAPAGVKTAIKLVFIPTSGTQLTSITYLNLLYKLT